MIMQLVSSAVVIVAVLLYAAVTRGGAADPAECCCCCRDHDLMNAAVRGAELMLWIAADRDPVSCCSFHSQPKGCSAHFSASHIYRL